MRWFFLPGAFAAAGALLFLEWRRPDRRRLPPRLLATFLAVSGLCFLAFPPTDPGSVRADSAAALWTAGIVKSEELDPFKLRFALPDAAAAAPSNAVVVPDAATLRRRFPEITTLHVFGNGLDPANLPSLTGLRVVFHPSSQLAASAPGIGFLTCPRQLVLGDPLVVQGRIEGLPAGTNLSLSLEAPDGAKTEAVAGPADDHGGADFTLRAAPVATAGRFVWQLRCGRIIEPLGVSVVAPLLPRVLVLEGEPRFDTAALRRWFEGAGGTMMVRTQIGKENVRFTSTRKETLPFTVLDAGLLGGYDLVLADGRALTTLRPQERTALATAVEQTGLGLLVMADDAVLPPDAPRMPPDLRLLLPWEIVPADDAMPNEERSIRPGWPGQPAASAIPVLSAPFVIEHRPDQTVLTDDRRAHTVAAAMRRGNGQLALTLVRDTTRWQRENDSAAFAAYWSFMFSRLARASDHPAGRWTLVDGDAGPVFVDHPLALRWTGPPGRAPGACVITEGPDQAPTPLPLRQDPRETDYWQGAFWPRHAGWQRVETTAGGAALDFFVHPAADWPALQATSRRMANQRFAAASITSSANHLSSAPAHAGVSPVWWFVLFVFAAGYLWIERRFANESSP